MTELSPILQRLVDSMFGTAQEQFREGKEVLPQATLLFEDEEGVVVVPVISMVDIFGSRNGKPILPTLIRRVYGEIISQRRDLKLLGISLLMDTWMEKTSKTKEQIEKEKREGLFVPPSQKPGSQEVILVQLTLQDKTKMFKWPYIRVGKEVLFSGKPEEIYINAIVPGLWPL